MPQTTAPQVLTAIALRDGGRVYMAADGEWTPDCAQAERIDDETLADLRLLDAEARGHEVSEPRIIALSLAGCAP